MLAAGLLLLLASVFPRVDDPWPRTIGLEFLVVMAGAGGAVASVLYAGASETRRNEAVRGGWLWGFRLGALFYALSVLNQIISG